jgi:hypothetical protein
MFRRLMLVLAGCLLFASMAGADEKPMVRITFANGARQVATLQAFGVPLVHCHLDCVAGKTDTGSEVRLPFDKIGAVQVVRPDTVIVFMRTGAQRVLTLTDTHLHYTDPDGGAEEIELGKVAVIEFLARP